MRGVGLFVACAAGMGAGLVLDTRHVEPAALASLCGGTADFGARLYSHWRLMPATHWGMVVVACIATLAQLAAPSRYTRLQRATYCLRESLCVVGMSLGMAYAMDYASAVSIRGGLAPFAGMVASMLAGMALGAGAVSLSMRIARRGVRLLGHALIEVACADGVGRHARMTPPPSFSPAQVGRWTWRPRRQG